MLSDPLSRVSAIRNANSTGTLYASYEYNGEGRLAQVDYPEIDVRLDYLQGASGTYKGFDRFGRAVDQYWDRYGMTADVDRIKHGYDFAGSRTYRDIDLPSYTANAKDPRELHISIGCALENLLIAAKHFGLAHRTEYLTVPANPCRTGVGTCSNEDRKVDMLRLACTFTLGCSLLRAGNRPGKSEPYFFFVDSSRMFIDFSSSH